MATLHEHWADVLPMSEDQKSDARGAYIRAARQAGRAVAGGSLVANTDAPRSWKAFGSADIGNAWRVGIPFELFGSSPAEMGAFKVQEGHVFFSAIPFDRHAGLTGFPAATTRRYVPIDNPAIIARLEQIEQLLRHVVTEAENENYPIPSPDMLKETERLVRWVVGQCANEYEVYPTEENQVVVEVYGGFGRRLSLTLDEDGGALCIVIVDLLARRATYEDSASMLPDGFLRDAVRDVGEKYSTGAPRFALEYVHDD